MPNFTPEQLVQYLYGEASPDLIHEIEKALQYDWTLQQKIAVLKESQQLLSAVEMKQPRKQSINAILDYARQAAEVEQ